MNLNWPILSVVTFLPLFGAVLIMVMVRGNERFARGTARWISLWTTLVTLAFSLVMVWRFDASSPEFQFVEKYNWLGIASYHMGVDGISLPFVILTTALMPICNGTWCMSSSTVLLLAKASDSRKKPSTP